jgi:hypothetical protein
MPPVCRHCGDELPDDSPPGLTSYRAYCDWRARQAGDMLGKEESKPMTLLAFICAWQVAIRDGVEVVPFWGRGDAGRFPLPGQGRADTVGGRGGTPRNRPRGESPWVLEDDIG